jgi:hypothetical protein
VIIRASRAALTADAMFEELAGEAGAKQEAFLQELAARRGKRCATTPPRLQQLNT